MGTKWLEGHFEMGHICHPSSCVMFRRERLLGDEALVTFEFTDQPMETVVLIPKVAKRTPKARRGIPHHKIGHICEPACPHYDRGKGHNHATNYTPRDRWTPCGPGCPVWEKSELAKVAARPILKSNPGHNHTVGQRCFVGCPWWEARMEEDRDGKLVQSPQGSTSGGHISIAECQCGAPGSALAKDHAPTCDVWKVWARPMRPVKGKGACPPAPDIFRWGACSCGRQTVEEPEEHATSCHVYKKWAKEPHHWGVDSPHIELKLTFRGQPTLTELRQAQSVIEAAMMFAHKPLIGLTHSQHFKQCPPRKLSKQEAPRPLSDDHAAIVKTDMATAIACVSNVLSFYALWPRSGADVNAQHELAEVLNGMRAWETWNKMRTL